MKKLPPIPPHLLDSSLPRPKVESKKTPPLLPGIYPHAPWGREIHAAYWFAPLLFFVAAMLAPINIFDQYPGLKEFCSQVIERFPFLAEHAKYSKIPQYVTAIKVLSFMLIPVFVAIPFLFLWKDRHVPLMEKVNSQNKAMPKWLEITGCLLLIILFFGNWMAGADPSSCKGCTTDSKFGAAWSNSAALLVFQNFIFAIAMAVYIRLGLFLGLKESNDE
jgi:hypothetical protein